MAHFMLVPTLLVFFLGLVPGQQGVRAQEANKHPKPASVFQQQQWLGEEEDPTKAVLILRKAVEQHPKASSLRYYLGVALIRKGELVGAQTSFEAALKLNPSSVQTRIALARALLLANQFEEAEKQGRILLAEGPSRADAHYVFGVIHFLSGDSARALPEVEASLNADGSFAPSFLLKSRALLLNIDSEVARAQQDRRQMVFADAALSLEKYFSMVPATAANSFLVDQLKAIRFHSVAGSTSPNPERKVFLHAEVTTKPRVISKPEPKYTEAARKADIRGTVALVVVVTDDGTVTNAVVLKSLPLGLAEQCLEAARKIKFTPATKDGKPVSTFIQVEYNFNLY